MRKRTISLMLAAAAALAAAVFAAPQNSLSHLEGRAAPAFKMTDTKGKVHTNKSLRGKVVLLDFWATWCGPCKAASPAMQRLHKKYAKKGLVVVGANTFDGSDGKAKSLAYAKQNKYSYTFTFGNDKLAQTLGIRGIPAFVFIGKDGKIAKTQVGFSPAMEAQFDATVRGLLAK
jgi:cytochrome c biogenesis protein CcmG, thiol:disulfide interchange protein DsbE